MRVRAGPSASILTVALLAGCAGGAPSPSPPAAAPLKVSVMLDSGSENDRSFNEYTLKGARDAAQAAGLGFEYAVPQSADDYESALEELIAAEQPDLVITVGFRMGDATAKSARRHPDVRFAIVDNAYAPGFGCAETVTDCYSEEGGLANVTSLMSAEDEAAYMAGVLAGCMTQSGIIATVAGQEIPPVYRLVTGFENGATDGVTEARNPQGELFGEERLAAVVTAARGGAEAVLESIVEAVATFTAGADQADDVTIVVVGRDA